MFIAFDERLEHEPPRRHGCAEYRARALRKRHTDHLGLTSDENGKDTVLCPLRKNAWLRSTPCPTIKLTQATSLNWMTRFETAQLVLAARITKETVIMRMDEDVL